MAIKRRLKGLSKLTRELLAEGESMRSDFKRQPDGISADDLVAFANSEAGGQILAGVDEQVRDSTQVGIVCGCDVSDATMLKVFNKAVSCIPPVSIDIYIENTGDKPILRVQVPPSQTKPHCTPKGVYCRRDGARNRPLHPNELLQLFLESEASAFAKRFEAAAERITKEIGDLEASLDSSIKNMSEQLGWAEYHLDGTQGTLQDIENAVATLKVGIENTNSRLRTLFLQDDRKDPVREKARVQYVNMCIKQIMEREDLFAHVVAGGKIKVNEVRSGNNDLTDEDVRLLWDIAVDHVYKLELDKKYEILVKDPEDCSDDEIDRFAAKVGDGDEVIEGVSGRAKKAFRLGFIVHDGAVIGTAALKKPTASYRAKVFRRAGSQLDPAVYTYELGWIFLDDNHRNKGQMSRLIDALLSAADNSALFATVRTSNRTMRDMLAKLKFSEEGSEYRSDRKPEDTIKLFVRSAPEVQAS